MWAFLFNISSFIEGYDPELPVLKSAVLHILVELLRVVKTGPPDGHSCCRQLFLTRAVILAATEGKKKESFDGLCLMSVSQKGWDVRRGWTYLMEVLSSSISSRSLLTSSCSCCLSCWSFPMCSTVFCNVTALLIWKLTIAVWVTDRSHTI